MQGMCLVLAHAGYALPAAKRRHIPLLHCFHSAHVTVAWEGLGRGAGRARARCTLLGSDHLYVIDIILYQGCGDRWLTFTKLEIADLKLDERPKYAPATANLVLQIRSGSCERIAFDLQYNRYVNIIGGPENNGSQVSS